MAGGRSGVTANGGDTASKSFRTHCRHSGLLPFGAAAHTRVAEELQRIGYVEEEFIMHGTANVYDWPGPGPAVVRTPNAPYTTRILVRRPASRARFSGTVAVEMMNPSNLFDLNLGWTISHHQFSRNGDAWVAITAKPVTAASQQSL